MRETVKTTSHTKSFRIVCLLVFVFINYPIPVHPHLDKEVLFMECLVNKLIISLFLFLVFCVGHTVSLFEKDIQFVNKYK